MLASNFIGYRQYKQHQLASSTVDCTANIKLHQAPSTYLQGENEIAKSGVGANDGAIVVSANAGAGDRLAGSSATLVSFSSRAANQSAFLVSASGCLEGALRSGSDTSRDVGWASSRFAIGGTERAVDAGDLNSLLVGKASAGGAGVFVVAVARGRAGRWRGRWSWGARSGCRSGLDLAAEANDTGEVGSGAVGILEVGSVKQDALFTILGVGELVLAVHHDFLDAVLGGRSEGGLLAHGGEKELLGKGAITSRGALHTSLASGGVGSGEAVLDEVKSACLGVIALGGGSSDAGKSE